MTNFGSGALDNEGDAGDGRPEGPYADGWAEGLHHHQCGRRYGAVGVPVGDLALWWLDRAEEGCAQRHRCLCARCPPGNARLRDARLGRAHEPVEADGAHLWADTDVDSGDRGGVLPGRRDPAGHGRARFAVEFVGTIRIQTAVSYRVARMERKSAFTRVVNALCDIRDGLTRISLRSIRATFPLL